ncbi:MAG: drug/metabolite exporter YedA [Pseudomonadota bacterium]
MSRRLQIALALFAVYVIWGSTYVAMAIGVRHFPPYLMGGMRYAAAGAAIFCFLLLRGERWPDRRVWGSALLSGILLLAIGNGAVNQAIVHVSSGLAALVIASSSLFAALFARFWGDSVSGREWAGIATGFVGVALLGVGTELKADPFALMLLVLASASWALGSIWSRHLPQPSSVWMASATQLLCGGAVMLLVGALRGEQLAMDVPYEGWLALAYLAVFGAVIAFSAYAFLLKHTRPALATSTAYVNPVIAVALGALLLAEPVTGVEMLAMLLVLAGVVLVTTAAPKQKSRA